MRVFTLLALTEVVAALAYDRVEVSEDVSVDGLAIGVKSCDRGRRALGGDEVDTREGFEDLGIFILGEDVERRTEGAGLEMGQVLLLVASRGGVQEGPTYQDGRILRNDGPGKVTEKKVMSTQAVT